MDFLNVIKPLVLLTNSVTLDQPNEDDGCSEETTNGSGNTPCVNHLCSLGGHFLKHEIKENEREHNSEGHW